MTDLPRVAAAAQPTTNVDAHPASVCVICVGNRMRGDDGIGPRVADAIRERGIPARLTICDGDPARMMAAWDGAELAIVVDAVNAGEAAGFIIEWDAVADDPPRAAFTGSTHAFGVAEAIALARALGSLPPRTVIVGIQIGALGPGEGLSPPVADAIPDVVARVEALLDDHHSKDQHSEGRPCTR